MWTSSLLKQNGWNSVKPHYWTALGVGVAMSIILGMAESVISVPAGIVGGVLDGIFGTDEVFYSLVLYILSFGVIVFVRGVLETGMSRYFYEARSKGQDLGNLFWGFQGGRYMPIVKVMFARYLQIFLWSLALYIPGIIKTYETILVPYLLAENPYLSKERALEISKRTMEGEKMKCLELQISFLGWYILGICACFIGIFGAVPYYEATMAEFYACMRAKMIAMCITTEEELTNNYDMNYGGGYPGNPYQNQNPYQQNPYQNQNPYQQSPYQNQNPYQQSPYQNQNPYEPKSPYQDQDTNASHKINLSKDSDDQNQY